MKCEKKNLCYLALNTHLMFALHSTDADVILIGFPRPFLQNDKGINSSTTFMGG